VIKSRYKNQLLSITLTFCTIFRDRFDSGDDDFFNSYDSPRGREGRQWHREEGMTGVPHDPNWGPRGESLIHSNYESRRGGRMPPYDDAIDIERRPPPRRRDGPIGMGASPRDRGGMPRELDYRREQLMREMDGALNVF